MPTTQPEQAPDSIRDQRTTYTDLRKRADALAECCTEMVTRGMWDNAASFARQFQEIQSEIRKLLGLDPRD